MYLPTLPFSRYNIYYYFPFFPQYVEFLNEQLSELQALVKSVYVFAQVLFIL